MLSLDDERWKNLDGGYRRPIDVRPLLERLELDSDLHEAWELIWMELYHQGDVGTASYVAVPHIVRIHRSKMAVDWNTYALVAMIEFAREDDRNPDVPKWACRAYFKAIHDLAILGLDELTRATPVAVPSILAVLAVTFDARKYGRLLACLADDEVDEVLGSRGKLALNARRVPKRPYPTTRLAGRSEKRE